MSCCSCCCWCVLLDGCCKVAKMLFLLLLMFWWLMSLQSSVVSAALVTAVGFNFFEWVGGWLSIFPPPAFWLIFLKLVRRRPSAEEGTKPPTIKVILKTWICHPVCQGCGNSRRPHKNESLFFGTHFSFPACHLISFWTSKEEAEALGCILDGRINRI